LDRDEGAREGSEPKVSNRERAAKDIERHLASEPVQARSPSPGYRFRRWVRRNKVMFSAGLTVASALLIGSGVSLWQAIRARSEASRASLALSELRASAPAFAAMARELANKERFAEAIAQLDVAIKLQPNTKSFVLAKADLLESQFRFAEAEGCYRAAASEESSGRHVSTNAELCHRLFSNSNAEAKPSREDLLQLFALMRKEQRSPVEMVRIAKVLGEESKLLLPYWRARLKDLPIAPEKPLEERLTIDEVGEMRLDLSATEVDDLSALEGMPLNHLDLTRCDRVTTISALRDMPLWVLHLDGTEVVDLSPIAQSKRLKKLSLSSTKVRDLVH
jgi:tetratricopeptide (TPR) repeat protein